MDSVNNYEKIQLDVPIEKNVSINITTTLARLNLCSQTIWALIHQSVLPGKIVLWISHDKYLADEGIDSIPTWAHEINSIREGILVVKWVANTGPYRKIIPALRSADNNDVLVYADDDVVYGANWLSKLLNAFNGNEDKVIAARVRKLNRNIFGRTKSYLYSTVICNEKVVKKDYVITGIGGVVIKKMHLTSEYIDLDDFLAICPTTDDLWISKILALSSTEVLVCPNAMEEISEIQHAYGLTLINNFDYSKIGLIASIIKKIKVKVLGQLGFPVCKNDHAIINIHTFFSTYTSKYK